MITVVGHLPGIDPPSTLVIGGIVSVGLVVVIVGDLLAAIGVANLTGWLASRSDRSVESSAPTETGGGPRTPRSRT